MHVDTSFLVDLLRERGRRLPGRATTFIESHANARFGASVFVACELEVGVARSASPDRERARIRAALQSIEIVYPDERFPPIYGELAARIRRNGQTVSEMDLMIAATAIIQGVPVVTANEKHFAVVPGLQVVSYR